MTLKALPPATVGGEEYAERVTAVVGAAFAGDAINRAVVLQIDSLPSDAEISNERRVEHFLPNIRKRSASGVLLVEAGDWAAVAAWVPPGVEVPPRDLNTLCPLILEYMEKFSAVEKRHLGDRQHWYLWVIARDPERKEPGVIRAVMEPYLQKAQEQGLPVWLEATNEHARDVYAYFGFKVVEEVVIGKGSIDENGNLVEGGKGVVIYGMIKEPSL